MPEVVVVGLGQVGTVLAESLAAKGSRVVPVRRGTPLAEVAREHPSPAVVAVCVAEDYLEAVLRDLPTPYRDRVLLVQNELRPATLADHGLSDPSVAVVWFETKRDKPLRVILSTPVVGPFAATLVDALGAHRIPSHEAPRRDLAFELAAKNGYILTTNLAGLVVGGTVHGLVHDHPNLFADVLREVLDVEEAVAGHLLDRAPIEEKVRRAIAADPEHVCTGRTAKARLRRTIAHAHAHGVSVPTLAAIAREQEALS